MDNEVFKNTKFNTLKTKINNLEKKIPDVTILIHINQYTQINKIQRKKLEMLIKKIPDTSGLVTTTIRNTKVSKVENKIPGTCGLLNTTVINKKLGDVENRIFNHDKYITDNHDNIIY